MDKAAPPVPPADPVAGLIDIPLPPEISLWPQTWLSQIAVVAALAALLAALVWFARWWQVNRYRRTALAELDRIERLGAGQAAAMTTDALALLLRRTALAAFPRETIAPLTGRAWLAFLDGSYGGQEFSQGVGRCLDRAPYERQSVAATELKPLAALVGCWIRTHHV